MTNTVLRLIGCPNATVAVESAAMGSVFWLGLNLGCLLAVAGVLKIRKAAQ